MRIVKPGEGSEERVERGRPSGTTEERIILPPHKPFHFFFFFPPDNTSRFSAILLPNARIPLGTSHHFISNTDTVYCKRLDSYCFSPTGMNCIMETTTSLQRLLSMKSRVLPVRLCWLSLLASDNLTHCHII